jgi:hypothetical protein
MNLSFQCHANVTPEREDRLRCKFETSIDEYRRSKDERNSNPDHFLFGCPVAREHTGHFGPHQPFGAGRYPGFLGPA